MATKKSSKQAKAKKPTLTINVTQEHIDNGVSLHASCPIALAIVDTLAKAGINLPEESVSVDGDEISISISKVPSAKAKAFIDKFDADMPEADDFVTDKYEDGWDNPAFHKAKEKWSSRVKPFSFNI